MKSEGPIYLSPLHGQDILGHCWQRRHDLARKLEAVSGRPRAHSGADKVTEPGGLREFVEAVRSQDKTLSLVEGGRHSLLDDPPSNAEALQIILAWLDRRLPRNVAVKVSSSRK